MDEDGNPTMRAYTLSLDLRSATIYRAVLRLARVGACALSMTLMLTACGAGNGSAGSPASPVTRPAGPKALESCTGDVTDWRELTGAAVPVAVLGDGPAVVFANDSGNVPCAWMDYARHLAESGRRVALFSYRDGGDETQELRDTQTVAESVRAGGDYAVVGASVGGRIVIELAAQHPAGLVAIVSLSGERQVQDLPDILTQARQVTIPSLYLGTTGDTYTNGARQPRELQSALHGHPKEILLREGFEHGTDLLESSPDAAIFRQRLDDFLARQLAAR